MFRYELTPAGGNLIGRPLDVVGRLTHWALRQLLVGFHAAKVRHIGRCLTRAGTPNSWPVLLAVKSRLWIVDPYETCI